MANKDILGLTAASTPLAGTEDVHLVQSGNSRQVNVSDLVSSTTVSAAGAAMNSENLSALASASTARTNLGLGTAAVANTGTSGTTLPFLDGANTFSAKQIVSLSSTDFVWNMTNSNAAGKGLEIDLSGHASEDYPALQVDNSGGTVAKIRGDGTAQIIDATDTTSFVSLELRKDSTNPLNYSGASYVTPVFLATWRDTTTQGAGNRDGAVFRFETTGDGSVATDSSESGGASSTVWRGLHGINHKTGDGSGHSFTATGELKAYGATGYNEWGGFQALATNTGSLLGSIHILEGNARDGTGANFAEGNAHYTGTAQAGASTTITLASGADTTDDIYIGYGIEIMSGTGSGQFRMISDYVGSTRVATVHSAWSTNPDATSVYEVRRMLDTTLYGGVFRTTRYYPGARPAYNILVSAEGTQSSSAILTTNQGGLRSWNRGIDFSTESGGTAVTFTSLSALKLDEGHRITWTDNTNTSHIYTTAGGIITLAAATSAEIASDLAVTSGDITIDNTQSFRILNSVSTAVDAITGNASNELLIKPLGGSANLELMDGNSVTRLLISNTEWQIRTAAMGSLQEVTLGSADSGGTGYKLLRVPN